MGSAGLDSIIVGLPTGGVGFRTMWGAQRSWMVTSVGLSLLREALESGVLFMGVWGGFAGACGPT